MPHWPRRAVVDIGSNSVRLVIFSGPPRVPVTITNEKALCGLGDRHPDTGNLRADAMERALAILRRFRVLIETEAPETLEVFATAAVRDAPNGEGFLQAIRKIGFAPRLLPGDEEARLAGLGILCSAPEILREGCPAIGGDLGGGSLDMSLLGGEAGDVTETTSLPIGSLRMLMEFGDDHDAACRLARNHFSAMPWLRSLNEPRLYVVGGSWRAIARVAMHQAEHPVPILDHFTMSADQALEVCRLVEETAPEDLGKISGVQKKRIPTLPMAAIVLRELINHAEASDVCVSACGVREGLLFDRLPGTLRETEPLFALADDLADRHSGGRKPRASAVCKFVDPLFDDSQAMRRLRVAAAKMIRMGNLAHPDRRSAHAAATIMAAPFLGIDHLERGLLTVMVKSRFQGPIAKSDPIVPLDLIDDEHMDYGVRVGLAHRLAASLRMPLFQEDSGFRIERQEDRITLHVDDTVADFVAETAVKDFDKLATAFSLPGEIVNQSGDRQV